MKRFAFSLVFLSIIATQQLSAQGTTTKAITARQVVGEIQKNLTCPWNKETVDTFKSGNPDDAVTGIAICMFADVETLQKAVARNCNLLIVHEPTFHNHLDKKDMISADPVFQAKIEYIKKHKLIIFRFHDHWHQTVPDGICQGMVDKLGWRAHQADKSLLFFRFEEQTVGEFAQKLQEKLNASPIRIVGNPQMSFTKVALSVGASGSASHIRLLNSKDTEVLIAGEAPEWETYQYVRDASMLGMKKAVLFTGHTTSEEAGMEYCAEWLKSFIKNVPVVYLENGSSFTTIQKSSKL